MIVHLWVENMANTNVKDTRLTTSDVVLKFLRSPEFADIVGKIVEKKTLDLQRKILDLHTEIDGLKVEITLLKESNIEFVHVATNLNNHRERLNSVDNSNKSKPVIAGETTYLSSTKRKVADESSLRSVDKTRREEKVHKQKQHDTNLRLPNLTTSNIISTPEIEAEKWEFPKYRRRYKKKETIQGQAKMADGDGTLKGIAKYVDFHVYRLHPDVTEDEVIEYLKKKNIHEVKCEKMSSKFPDEYSSFKVSVSTGCVEEFKKPEIWPEHTCINRFLHRLVKKSTLDKNQQATDENLASKKARE